LHQIAGQTHVINYPTVAGVYVFADNSCLLIDSGPSPAFGRRTLKILGEAGLTVAGIFATHAHSDHCSANQVIQEATGCPVYASAWEACAMQQPELTPFCLYSASPLPALRNKYLMPPPTQDCIVVEEGETVINGVSFDILSLRGHSLGQLGIRTPDGVFFSADSLIMPAYLQQFPFLYLADVKGHLDTLEWLQNYSSPYWFPSHGAPCEDPRGIIALNNDMVMSWLEWLKEMLSSPRTREEITARALERLKMNPSRSQYFLILASISAYLAYLEKNSFLHSTIQNGHLYFQAIR
jgi:glyoxylase-like metal-dependent hydrolase (beta-lactamase superfamily II)